MPEKILIVEDDADTVRLFGLMLQKQGYQVYAARNGMEALAMAHKVLPDLIILDVMLPGADGFEIAQSLHRKPDTATIPILMVTARNTTEDKVHGYEVGADIYLTKPVQQLDLQANIRVLLSQRQARKAAAASTQQGCVLGVMSAKGGLGVSTVALNLAISYAKKYSEKVIAAELRPGHGCWADELNLPTNFGLDELFKMEPSAITPALVDSLLTHTDHRARLLLTSNLTREPVHSRDDSHYAAIIAGMAALANLVVLDIGTYFSSAVPTILEKCNEMVVVTEPQVLPVKQSARLLDMLRNFGFGAARPLTIMTLNHTRSDVSLSVSQVEDLLKRPVALGVPPAMELSAHAIRNNIPMVSAQPESLFAQQFAKLDEIIKKHTEAL